MCVIFFNNEKDMGTHITLSQLDAAAPESSYPLGDKPVSQPALFQTLVGHSVIVVRHCRRWGEEMHARGREQTCITGSRLANEFEFLLRASLRIRASLSFTLD